MHNLKTSSKYIYWIILLPVFSFVSCVPPLCSIVNTICSYLLLFLCPCAQVPQECVQRSLHLLNERVRATALSRNGLSRLADAILDSPMAVLVNGTHSWEELGILCVCVCVCLFVSFVVLKPAPSQSLLSTYIYIMHQTFTLSLQLSNSLRNWECYDYMWSVFVLWYECRTVVLFCCISRFSLYFVHIVCKYHIYMYISC